MPAHAFDPTRSNFRTQEVFDPDATPVGGMRYGIKRYAGGCLPLAMVALNPTRTTANMIIPLRN